MPLERGVVRRVAGRVKREGKRTLVWLREQYLPLLDQDGQEHRTQPERRAQDQPQVRERHLVRRRAARQPRQVVRERPQEKVLLGGHPPTEQLTQLLEKLARGSAVDHADPGGGGALAEEVGGDGRVAGRFGDEDVDGRFEVWGEDGAGDWGSVALAGEDDKMTAHARSRNQALKKDATAVYSVK